MSDPQIVIIGAGPAGLTAALELTRSGRRPLVLEADSQVGGISKTINFNGNRMDLGGHRFFSKSDWVMNWWQDVMPVSAPSGEAERLVLGYQNQQRTLNIHSAASGSDEDDVLLVRPRLSRIYHMRKFFDYPVTLNRTTATNLGLLRMARIGTSYAAAQVWPRKPEQSLEDFLINRFGRELFETFFRDYTEKVWGISCKEISADWGAQRIKGLSIAKALLHAARQATGIGAANRGGKVETSLIEHFLYPKFGPGQLWEKVARMAAQAGTEVRLNHRVIRIHHVDNRIASVDVLDTTTQTMLTVPCSHLISTMPIQELVNAFDPAASSAIQRVTNALPYRDFMTAGLLLQKMTPPRGAGKVEKNGMPPDNWIYVQEPDVKLGRLQIFNNWSPAMVQDHPKIFLGLEYFCGAGGDLWSMRDSEFLDFAAMELEKIGLIQRTDVESGIVVRVPKAYPAYFGTYDQMPRIKEFLGSFVNLLPVGRNGMHRYNNQDHSMVSAKIAVDCILDPSLDRSAVWDVNTEPDYHESK